MRLYSIYDENGYITHSEFSEECPINGTELLVSENFRTPKLVNGVIIDENPYNEEEILEIKTQSEYYLYEKRKDDGQSAYILMCAKLRTLKLSGVITEEQHKNIDTLLEPIGNSVFQGQWISAKDKLEDLGSEVIGVDLYNEIHSKLSAYIAENY